MDRVNSENFKWTLVAKENGKQIAEYSCPSEIVGDIIKILGVRFIIGIALALAAYFILPLPLEYRQALVIVFLAPVASANPPFTAQMGSDFGLASAINSVSIIASIVLITTALVIML